MNSRPKVWRVAAVVAVLALLAYGLPAAAVEAPGSDDPRPDCEPDRVLWLQDPPMTGHDVKELQLRLLQLGYDPGSPDGIFGPRTAKAVRAFQEAAGLKARGFVGELTWEALAGPPQRFAVPANVLPKPKGVLKIVINTYDRTLTLYADNKPYRVYGVAVGHPETPSQTGDWKIAAKRKNWGNGFGSRWMQLSVPYGTYGIHGTNKPWSIGTATSLGCIRMLNPDVEELYEWVEEGTPVEIVGPPPALPDWARTTYQRGAKGWEIVAIQLGLREQGFYAGPADGL
ncbi:MAG: L,D-transpeptidase family protein, partial [Actinobacteria bacterium]|nr:L,D-transpeptidase family protein [Actinomycetota bacterium]